VNLNAVQGVAGVQDSVNSAHMLFKFHYQQAKYLVMLNKVAVVGHRISTF
jgi:hypothetical protein